MIGDGPPGHVPGQFMKPAKKGTKPSFDTIYARVAAKGCIPCKSYLHIDEIIAADDGYRTIPKYDADTDLKVHYLLGTKVDPAQKVLPQPISEDRCPYIMHDKLDMFLVLSGKAILMRPRPHHEFTMHYLLYCCVVLDPGNITMWNDGPVVHKYAEKIPYLNKVMSLMSTAADGAIELGYLTNSEDHYNNYLAIIKANNNLLKYRRYATLYPEKKDEHEQKMRAEFDIRNNRLDRLTKFTYSYYRTASKGELSQQDHTTRFNAIMTIIGCFDYLQDQYTQAEIDMLVPKTLTIDYNLFLTTRARLGRVYEALLHDMTREGSRKESKLDKLTPQDRALLGLLAAKFPKKKILSEESRTGESSGSEMQATSKLMKKAVIKNEIAEDTGHKDKPTEKPAKAPKGNYTKPAQKGRPGSKKAALTTVDEKSDEDIGAGDNVDDPNNRERSRDQKKQEESFTRPNLKN